MQDGLSCSPLPGLQKGAFIVVLLSSVCGMAEQQPRGFFDYFLACGVQQCPA